MVLQAANPLPSAEPARSTAASTAQAAGAQIIRIEPCPRTVSVCALSGWAGPIRAEQGVGGHGARGEQLFGLLGSHDGQACWVEQPHLDQH
jgi:hypothetical protein